MRRLLIRPGAIGDCILSLPALECLRADYTEVWVPSPVVPLIRFADHVRAIAATGLDLLGIPDVEPPQLLLDTLRSFDSIISWYGTGRAEFREEMARLGLPVRFLPALPGEGLRVHAADFYLEQASAFAATPHPAVPRIACPPALDHGFAVIHPFSGSAKKNWPLESFREVARRLESRVPVHWCAGPEDVLEGAVRYGDLYQLACWLAGARVFVGNDSGIAHLAAAAGTPVVALFGPSDPLVWGPRGPRVRIVATQAPGEPVSGIRVDTVTAAVEELFLEA